MSKLALLLVVLAFVATVIDGASTNCPNPKCGKLDRTCEVTVKVLECASKISPTCGAAAALVKEAKALYDELTCDACIQKSSLGVCLALSTIAYFLSKRTN